MKSIEKALLELEDLVNNKMSDYNLPVAKGKTLRIGNLIVRNSKRFGYVIIDAATNKSIDKAHSKYGAVALANAYLNNLSANEVKRFDDIIEKNANDSYFYINSINTTTDEFRQAVLKSRLEIAQSKIDSAKLNLDKFILKHNR